MKTVFYNTTTKELGKIRNEPYIVDGKPGVLPSNKVELTVVEDDKPTVEDHEITESKWVADLENKEYRKEWTVRDKTEEELTSEQEREAENTDNFLPPKVIKAILQKDVENKATSEEELLAYKEIYPSYRIGKRYITDEKFQYKNKLWKVLQNHTSQLDWKPGVASSLYTEIQPEGTIAEWTQPEGAHDAYQTGNQVTHNGSTWESSVDDNVWEPGQYGWTQI